MSTQPLPRSRQPNHTPTAQGRTDRETASHCADNRIFLCFRVFHVLWFSTACQFGQAHMSATTQQLSCCKSFAILRHGRKTIQHPCRRVPPGYALYRKMVRCMRSDSPRKPESGNSLVRPSQDEPTQLDSRARMAKATHTVSPTPCPVPQYASDAGVIVWDGGFHERRVSIEQLSTEADGEMPLTLTGQPERSGLSLQKLECPRCARPASIHGHQLLRWADFSLGCH